jgi:hypothetical protein
MPARAIRDADADNSFLDKQCSSVINCCSFGVGFPAIRQRLPGGRREADHRATEPDPGRTALTCTLPQLTLANRVRAGLRAGECEWPQCCWSGPLVMVGTRRTPAQRKILERKIR